MARPTSLRESPTETAAGRPLLPAGLPGLGSSFGGTRGPGDRRRLLLGGLLVVLVLILLRLGLNRGVEQRLDTLLAQNLTTILDADITALGQWIESERTAAAAWADHEIVRTAVTALVAVEDEKAEVLLAVPEVDELCMVLAPVIGQANSCGVGILGRTGRVLASTAQELAVVGLRTSPEGSAVLSRALAGETVVVPPYAEGSLVAGMDMPEDMPIMSIATPVRDAEGFVVAALFVRIDPREDFTRILSVARMGDSGETYAVNAAGLMLSESLFEEELKRVGLLPDGPDVGSALRVQVRDPGGDLTHGFETDVPLAARPLTFAAASTAAGVSGVDVAGYRGYRGVQVVGAWRWLPEYRFGVITEVDRAEAKAVVAYLHDLMWIPFAVVALAGAWIVFSTRSIQRLRRRVDAARQLGQYTLGDKLGEGGMGAVYRARHAMLRRPTAVKILKPDQVSEETVARFEREVQLTSELTHPNTIDIYDFGHTPEGTFYYAMEYLEGCTLAELVQRHGALPPARVAHILVQVCGSLGEAHRRGLIHRDIKPQNIALCRRGGMADVAKVLDFGLVKDTAETDVQLTAAHQLSGTPLYMPPERLRDPTHVDPGVDVYALGAVAYYLLTGSTVFEGASLIEVVDHVLNDAPLPPSERTRVPLPAALERLVLDCLSKRSADRPASVDAIIDRLEAMQGLGSWTQCDAREWWEAHMPDESGRGFDETCKQQPAESPPTVSLAAADV